MTEYVVDLAVIYDKETPPPGYRKINQDLNQGAGGSSIYLCYKNSSSEQPITGLNVLASLLPDFAIQNGYTKVEGDLNKGAGVKYIYVCYTKDQSLPLPIRNISVIVGDNSHVYPPVNEIRIGQDCNDGAGGKYIYICYSY